VVLFGKEYWKGMLDWLNNTVVKHGSLHRKELRIFTVVDRPEEVVAAVKRFYEKA
jgi:predicted Rossmann-fold nucleotide-binding protein